MNMQYSLHNTEDMCRFHPMCTDEGRKDGDVEELSSAWSPDDDIVLEWAGRAEGISEDQ